MLTVELPEFRYHRLIAENLDTSTTMALKNNFDYSFVVCYGSISDPDYEITKKNACLFDLTKGLDYVFSKFNATSRNEVRRSEKISELSFYSNINDFNFDEYYYFHQKCEHDRNWYPVPPEELKNSLIFTATYNGMFISGMSCYEHGERIRVGRIYSSKRSMQSDILNNVVYGCASKRIVYEICKYAIQKNFKTLDLGGIDVIDPLKAGITKFKLSLGGDLVPVKIARWSNEKFRQQEHLIREKGWDLT